MFNIEVSASSDSEYDGDYDPNRASDEGDESGDEGYNTCNLNSQKSKITKEEEKKEAEIKSNSSAAVDEKQHAKDLWENFLKDVESVTPKKNSNSALYKSSITDEIQNKSGSPSPEINTKPLCKVFEFAGETVTVFDKDLNSCDSLSQQPTPQKNNSEPCPTEKPYIAKKRGLDSVLGTIMNKNKKLSVLDKTLIDWKIFKKNEGLDSDLKKFNKGKQGFIERQRFLERSDLKSFEMEKFMRQKFRKK